MKTLHRYLSTGRTTRSNLRIAVWFLSLFFVFGALADPAMAQNLMPHDEVAKLLAARYGEQPVARGLTQTGVMIEVFAAPRGETWTIVFTTPRGLSRIGPAGVAWTALSVETSHFSSSRAPNWSFDSDIHD